MIGSPARGEQQIVAEMRPGAATFGSGDAGAAAGSRLTSIELFSGAGGLALGTHLAGFHHRLLLEWNADARDTLRTNAVRGAIPGIETWRVARDDARDLDFGRLGPVDLVAGGPPCQPFSIGGKHGGWGDTRDMIPQFVRSVRELTPRAFIMENVRGLLRTTFRTYFTYVVLQLSHPTVVRRDDESWSEHLQRLEDLHTSGKDNDVQYRVVFRLLNAADYGVPQTRARVFIVGFRADTDVTWHFPDPTHDRDALLHELWVSGAYWKRHGVDRPERSALSVRRPNHRFMDASLKPWRTVRDAIADLPPPNEEETNSGYWNHELRLGARSYPGHTGSALDWPAKTLKAGDHGVPGGENMIAFADGSVRYLTVREAARLQTFPDPWRIEGAWSEAMRQLGNAVPVTLARVVATSVAERLHGLG